VPVGGEPLLIYCKPRSRRLKGDFFRPTLALSWLQIFANFELKNYSTKYEQNTKLSRARQADEESSKKEKRKALYCILPAIALNGRIAQNSKTSEDSKKLIKRV
jgi:hypothetical protein